MSSRETEEGFKRFHKNQWIIAILSQNHQSFVKLYKFFSENLTIWRKSLKVLVSFDENLAYNIGNFGSMPLGFGRRNLETCKFSNVRNVLENNNF